jgi:NADH-quinone oxidoreductase subunit N
MHMTMANLTVILPHLVLTAGTAAVLLLASVSRSRDLILAAAAATLFCALLAVGAAAKHIPASATPLFQVDGVGLFSMGAVLFAGLCIVPLTRPYLERHGVPAGAFAVLLLLAALGGTVVVSSSHAASLFLGIELLGIPIVVLAAYLPAREHGIEAGFKYLVLAGLSAALLLFGLALLYAESGTLSLAALVHPAAGAGGPSRLYHIGIALIVAGLAFKLALAPFHQWSPDVYDGAPAPVAMIAATISKASVIALLLRILPPSFAGQDRFLFGLLAAISVASMTVGNLGAIAQRNVKRMLAYSSIAQNGYLLIAFLSPGPLAPTAVLLFLVFTVVTNLASFGAITLLSRRDRDADDLDGYRGLYWRQPGLAIFLGMALLSLLGIPVTAGFIAKFALVAAGMKDAHIVLVLLLAVFTAVSAFYYLRVIMTMFREAEEAPAVVHGIRGQVVPGLAMAVLALQAGLLVFIGTMPQYVLGLLRSLL